MRFEIFRHYSDYSGPWLWPDFTPQEVACRHCGEFCLDEPSMHALQDLRRKWGRPIIINSGHRCAEHNAREGGAKGSRHLHLAFDCRVGAEEGEAFAELARACGFNGIGLYPGFVHVDMRAAPAFWQSLP